MTKKESLKKARAAKAAKAAKRKKVAGRLHSASPAELKKEGVQVGQARLGVIASIAEYLTKSPVPLSKRQILARLKKRFPNRDEIKMLATIGAQLPGRMSRERDLNISRDSKGRYFVSK